MPSCSQKSSVMGSRNLIHLLGIWKNENHHLEGTSALKTTISHPIRVHEYRGNPRVIQEQILDHHGAVLQLTADALKQKPPLIIPFRP